MRVEIDTDNIEVLVLAAQLGPEAAGEHIPGLKLGDAIGLSFGLFLGPALAGDDVDDRIHMNEPGPRHDGPNGIHGLNCGANELRLEFKAALGYEWKHRAFIARSPGEKRDLVNGHEKTLAIEFVQQPAGKGFAVTSQSGDEIRFEQIQIIGPAKMA